MKRMRIKKLAVLLPALFAATMGQAANTTYDSTAGTATIPEVVVNGMVEFVNVKLKANPDGTFSVLSTEAPVVSASAAIYDPAAGSVTIPAVGVNDKVEFLNVRLEFISGDTLRVLSFDEPAALQTPAAADTAYDPATGTATIPEVVIDGKVAFVNVKLQANQDGTFSVLSAEQPEISADAATYDPATGTVTIPAVEADGKVAFTNVRLGLSSDQTLLSVISSEVPEKPTTPPVVYHSQNCSDFVEATYTQDNGETVTGMYCVQGDKEHEELPAFTCTPEDEQLAKVEVGMNYDQVVELAGCHPMLGSDPGKRVVYFWGAKWEPDSWEQTHEVGFVDSKIASKDDVFCGPAPCHVAVQP
jgi:hypothetical protein